MAITTRELQAVLHHVKSGARSDSSWKIKLKMWNKISSSKASFSRESSLKIYQVRWSLTNSRDYGKERLTGDYSVNYQWLFCNFLARCFVFEKNWVCQGKRNSQRNIVQICSKMEKCYFTFSSYFFVRNRPLF